jgi:hypothetical protein
MSYNFIYTKSDDLLFQQAKRQRLKNTKKLSKEQLFAYLGIQVAQ